MDAKQTETLKVRVLASVTASVAGQSLRLEQGQELVLPAADALEHARGGYLEVLADEAAPETPRKRASHGNK